MSENADPRVRRTHEALREALVELTLEQGYGRTKVREVLERAEVARSTFYAHFEGKFDLMFGSMTLFQLAPGPDGGVPPVTRVFSHAGSFVDLYRALRDHGDLEPFRRKALGDLTTSLTEIFAGLAPAQPPEFLGRFYAAALVESLFAWLEDGAGPSPEEMDRRFQALVRGGLAAG